jgi:hypothetical protein
LELSPGNGPAVSSGTFATQSSEGVVVVVEFVVNAHEDF